MSADVRTSRNDYSDRRPALVEADEGAQVLGSVTYLCFARLFGYRGRAGSNVETSQGLASGKGIVESQTLLRC